MEGIQKAIEMVGKQLQTINKTAPKNIEEAATKEYKFWETQPVPRISQYANHVLI